MAKKIGSVVATLALVVAGHANAQAVTVTQDHTQLSDTVHMLVPNPATAGNLAVSAGVDGILVVDDQLETSAQSIRDAVEAIQPGRIDFLVNSHYHFDHAGSNAAFGADSTIVAHKSVRMRLAEGREAGARFIQGDRPREALPKLTFEDSVTIHFNGEDIDIIHLQNPAHTDGDAVIFFRGSNVIHLGDQFINLGGFPYIDRDVGGSAVGLRDNLATIMTMIDDHTRIIPGHGPLAMKSDLKNFYDLVADTIDIVAAHKRDGKTLPEIQEAGLPEQYAGASGFIPEGLWIQFIYESL